MGVDLAVMGDKEPQADSDELVHYSEPARGVYKKLIIRNGRLAGAILLGDGMAAPNVLQSFDRGEILPENRASLLFPGTSSAPRIEVADLPPTPRFATATASPRARLTKRSNLSRTEIRPSAQSAPPPGPAPAAAPASPRCKPSWTMQRGQPCLSP